MSIPSLYLMIVKSRHWPNALEQFQYFFVYLSVHSFVCLFIHALCLFVSLPNFATDYLIYLWIYLSMYPSRICWFAGYLCIGSTWGNWSFQSDIRVRHPQMCRAFRVRDPPTESSEPGSMRIFLQTIILCARHTAQNRIGKLKAVLLCETFILVPSQLSQGFHKFQNPAIHNCYFSATM